MSLNFMFIQFEAKYNPGTTFALLFHYSQKNFHEEISVLLEERLSYVIQYPVKRGAVGAATLQVRACAVFLIYVISNRKLRL